MPCRRLLPLVRRRVIRCGTYSQTEQGNTSQQQHLDDNTIGKMSLRYEDCLCPICLEILIEPVTMPCNHELCMPCFESNVTETSLNCPMCRLRISNWARHAARTKTMVNQTRWRCIRKFFPEQVSARLSGRSDYISPVHVVSHVLAKPGEIRREYEDMVKRNEEQIRIERAHEEAASLLLINRLQELDVADAHIKETDEFIAQHLQEITSTQELERILETIRQKIDASTKAYSAFEKLVAEKLRCESAELKARLSNDCSIPKVQYEPGCKPQSSRSKPKSKTDRSTSNLSHKSCTSLLSNKKSSLESADSDVKLIDYVQKGPVMIKQEHQVLSNECDIPLDSDASFSLRDRPSTSQRNDLTSTLYDYASQNLQMNEISDRYDHYKKRSSCFNVLSKTYIANDGHSKLSGKPLSKRDLKCLKKDQNMTSVRRLPFLTAATVSSAVNFDPSIQHDKINYCGESTSILSSSKAPPDDCSISTISTQSSLSSYSPESPSSSSSCVNASNLSTPNSGHGSSHQTWRIGNKNIKHSTSTSLSTTNILNNQSLMSSTFLKDQNKRRASHYREHLRFGQSTNAVGPFSKNVSSLNSKKIGKNRQKLSSIPFSYKSSGDRNFVDTNFSISQLSTIKTSSNENIVEARKKQMNHNASAINHSSSSKTMSNKSGVNNRSDVVRFSGKSCGVDSFSKLQLQSIDNRSSSKANDQLIKNSMNLNVDNRRRGFINWSQKCNLKSILARVNTSLTNRSSGSTRCMINCSKKQQPIVMNVAKKKKAANDELDEHKNRSIVVKHKIHRRMPANKKRMTKMKINKTERSTNRRKGDIKFKCQTTKKLYETRSATSSCHAASKHRKSSSSHGAKNKREKFVSRRTKITKTLRPVSKSASKPLIKRPTRRLAS